MDFLRKPDENTSITLYYLEIDDSKLIPDKPRTRDYISTIKKFRDDLEIDDFAPILDDSPRI